jgi:hypothetical protein
VTIEDMARAAAIEIYDLWEKFDYDEIDRLGANGIAIVITRHMKEYESGHPPPPIPAQSRCMYCGEGIHRVIHNYSDPGLNGEWRHDHGSWFCGGVGGVEGKVATAADVDVDSDVERD